MHNIWITFDCYGTLIDWRTGMEQALRRVAPDASTDLLAAYHDNEPSVQQEDGHRDYRTVMREALRRAATDIGVELTAKNTDVLGETLPTWPQFPATAPTLRELVRRGYSLGILSNVDETLIVRTLATFPVPMACVITSEAIGSYKPAPGHFTKFAEHTKATPQNWVHVGCSAHHDIEPAHRAGLASVLVNYTSQPHPAAATRVINDLTTLPDTIDAILANGEQPGHDPETKLR